MTTDNCKRSVVVKTVVYGVAGTLHITAKDLIFQNVPGLSMHKQER